MSGNILMLLIMMAFVIFGVVASVVVSIISHEPGPYKRTYKAMMGDPTVLCATPNYVIVGREDGTIEKMKGQPVEALMCKNCGAPIDREEMECQYCGVQYR